MSLTAMPSVVPVSSPSAEASLVLTQSRANCSRAAALREVLKYSEAVTKEAESTLSGYSGHLETLFTSVQEVATQAEELTSAQRNVNEFLQQTNRLVEQMAVPKAVDAKIKQGPKADFQGFLAAWNRLHVCIAALAKYRGGEAVDDVYCMAESQDNVAKMLAYDDFEQLQRRYARLPHVKKPGPAMEILATDALRGAQDIVPPDIVTRMRELYEAIRRSGPNRCYEVYVDIRGSLLYRSHLLYHNNLGFEDLDKLPWLQFEKRLQRWVQYNTVIPCHLVQEQYLAHSIFGVTLGSQAFLDIVLPKAPEEDRFASKRFTTTLLDWKRIPEKIYALLNVGEKFAVEFPFVQEMLPKEITAGYQHMFLRLVEEARLTFATFASSLTQDLNRHSVGDGSIHPLAAQTVTVLRRIMTYTSCTEVLFPPTDDEPTGEEFNCVFNTVCLPSQKLGPQINVERLLDTLWRSLEAISNSCKNKALAALFLMNNAHYLLKAVQLSRQFSFISKEWRGDCEAKLEEYGLQYQQHSWGPLLKLMQAEVAEKKAPWQREQALIKERWRLLNLGLDSLIEQQRGWSVPDQGLRTNLQEVIVEDVITVYREFWKRYEELPFTRYPMKYLVTSPDTLQDIVMNQLLQSHADVHTHTPTPLAALDNSVRPARMQSAELGTSF